MGAAAATQPTPTTPTEDDSEDDFQPARRPALRPAQPPGAGPGGRSGGGAPAPAPATQRYAATQAVRGTQAARTGASLAPAGPGPAASTQRHRGATQRPTQRQTKLAGPKAPEPAKPARVKGRVERVEGRGAWLHIAGHHLNFPFRPYGSQIIFMERNLRGLAAGTNSLLEAPTGSGKTLSLLCSTLAWQQKRWEAAGAGDGAGDGARVPQVFYATRTHSQVAQVVAELRTTAYAPSMAVLAARQHYCVHKEVKAGKVGADVNEGCYKVRSAAEGCSFKRNQRALVRMHGTDLLVHDIEDLVVAGRRKRACPYYASHQMVEQSDLVLCPYSYLLDPIVRGALGIDVRGAVLIFDEAHNIEDMAREAASFELPASRLRQAYEAFQGVLAAGKHRELYLPLNAALQSLLSWLEAMSASEAMQQVSPTLHERIWEGRQIFERLLQCGLGKRDTETLLRKVADLRALEENAEEDELKVGPGALAVLTNIFGVLHMLYQNGEASLRDYRLVVRRHRDRHAEEGTWEVSFCAWCLNPAVAFKELEDQAHSVILTSGTLAPLATFASELGAAFVTELQAPHVVDIGKRLLARTLPVIHNKAIRCTYKNTDSSQLQDALGEGLVGLAGCVPDGMLVFLPSYTLLEKLKTRWMTTGVWRRLGRIKKEVLTEPKFAGDYFEKVLKKHYRAVKSGRGSIIFAVCRGKVSEGMNFADANARGVVVIGIPFPSFRERKVQLKREYNDKQRAAGKEILPGEAWYSQQAFRALNQAVGRCLRHREDYGSIFMVDERFALGSHSKQLSNWLQSGLRVETDFQRACRDTAAFFQALQAEGASARAPAPAKAAAARGRALREVQPGGKRDGERNLKEIWGGGKRPKPAPL